MQFVSLCLLKFSYRSCTCTYVVDLIVTKRERDMPMLDWYLRDSKEGYVSAHSGLFYMPNNQGQVPLNFDVGDQAMFFRASLKASGGGIMNLLEADSCLCENINTRAVLGLCVKAKDKKNRFHDGLLVQTIVEALFLSCLALASAAWLRVIG